MTIRRAVRAVENWLAAGHLDAGAPIVVACSGGADSLALAAAVLRSHRSGPARRLVAAIVDHGLQEGSSEVAGTAAEHLRALGFDDVRILPVTVGSLGGMEAAARQARYGALRNLAEQLAPSTGILLGHTADDQAETVLLGLARGSGPRSIAGMRPWRAPWGRPLLGLRRADTEAVCAELGLTPWQDPHNADPSFTRVRVRREILPLLDEVLGGGVVPALARTSDLLADDLAALASIAAAAGAICIDAAGAVDCGRLAEQPAAVRTRVLRRWIADRIGVATLTFDHLRRLDDLVIRGRDGSAVRLPGGRDAIRSGTVLVLRPADRRDDRKGRGVAAP